MPNVVRGAANANEAMLKWCEVVLGAERIVAVSIRNSNGFCHDLYYDSQQRLLDSSRGNSLFLEWLAVLVSSGVEWEVLINTLGRVCDSHAGDAFDESDSSNIDLSTNGLVVRAFRDGEGGIIWAGGA